MGELFFEGNLHNFTKAKVWTVPHTHSESEIIYINSQSLVFSFSSQSLTVRTGLSKERNEENQAHESVNCETVNILVRSLHAPSFPLQSIKDGAFKYS